MSINLNKCRLFSLKNVIFSTEFGVPVRCVIIKDYEGLMKIKKCFANINFMFLQAKKNLLKGSRERALRASKVTHMVQFRAVPIS